MCSFSRTLEVFDAVLRADKSPRDDAPTAECIRFVDLGDDNPPPRETADGR